ncbi:hypothetical protein LTR95_017566 [Oleoguttula sp. CCFEE 5521]
MAQQHQSFAEALTERLPHELVDMIAELVFKNNYTVHQTIEAGYRPPSNLQVNRVYRKRLLIGYYQHTTFTMELEGDRPGVIDCWIDSIPLEVRGAIYRRGDWWSLRLRSPDLKECIHLPNLFINLHRWWVVRACDLCRKRVKYWKVFTACGVCKTMIDGPGHGLLPKDLESWRRGELTLETISLAAA